MKKNLINDCHAKGTRPFSYACAAETTKACFFKARVILLLLLFSMELFATSYTWKVWANKESAYVNEAIYLSFVCEFSDEAQFYAVEFDPVESDENLTIKMLSERSKIEDGKKILHYEFVAFVHKAGSKEFAFEAMMKKTTKESVENTVIGRDNGKYAEYQNIKVPLRRVKVNVLESNAALVGDFRLEAKSDKAEVKALTPYHLELSVVGVGNFEALQALAFEIEGVKLFSEEPKKKLTLTPEGERGVWSQKFAFVSERDFSVEAFEIEYFHPQTRERRALKFDGVDVKVEEGYKREELLDTPTREESFFEWERLYYILSFAAGFLLAKLELTRFFKRKEDPWRKKIQSATSLEALSILLILEDAQKYERVLKKIESKELSSLTKAKRLTCG